jgi:hypothetical protein
MVQQYKKQVSQAATPENYGHLNATPEAYGANVWAQFGDLGESVARFGMIMKQRQDAADSAAAAQAAAKHNNGSKGSGGGKSGGGSGNKKSGVPKPPKQEDNIEGRLQHKAEVEAENHAQSDATLERMQNESAARGSSPRNDAAANSNANAASPSSTVDIDGYQFKELKSQTNKTAPWLNSSPA